MNKRLAMALALPLWLTGCALLRSPAPAPPTVPGQWQFAAAAQSPTTARARTDFWASLGDPLLPDMQARALRANNELKLATLQWKLARVQAALVATTDWPDVALGASATQSRSLTAQGPYPATTHRSAGLGASLGYPVDVWGSRSAQQDAAAANTGASEADWHAARLLLQVSVAQGWWQLGYLNRVIDNAQSDVEQARVTLRLAQVRYQAGATSGADVVFAQQALSAQLAAFTQNRQLLVETRSTFALLMGAPPESTISEPDDLVDSPLPAPEPGLPADLLGRRADVHAAELRVRSYLATADATRLSFYPTLALTSNLGTASQTLTQYLANPVASVSAAIALPFLQFNTARLSTQAARLSYEAARVTFSQTLLQALKDAEDALSARQQLLTRDQYLRQYVADSREAERLTRVRWELGQTDIQPWLDAQSARRQAELALLQNTLLRKQNAAQLYAALGGDYQAPAHAPAAPSPFLSLSEPTARTTDTHPQGTAK